MKNTLTKELFLRGEIFVISSFSAASFGFFGEALSFAASNPNFGMEVHVSALCFQTALYVNVNCHG